MIPLPVRALAAMNARTYLELKGGIESPPNSNEGFWIDLFKQKFGGGKNWAWCMYYVQFTLDESYEIYTPLLGWVNPFDDMSLSERGHCMSVWRFAQKNGRLSIIPADALLKGEKIPRHSIFILGRADDTGHTGWTVSHWQDDGNHRNDIIKTMEGNMSNQIGTGTYKLSSLMDRGLKGIIY
ncbi:MAG: hypothetical protein AMJ79_12775 [Phycisphaerae bacterium SM23_30]|nr:MAG: hypothetical protein AMJ79_12775 [Phycisphaerae bacterium SM23_30]